MIVLTSAFVLLSAFSCGGGGKATGTNEQSEKENYDSINECLFVIISILLRWR